MHVLSAIDPAASARRKGRLVRPSYHCEGPNSSWHLDGWDKLKPFGFSIHGCIDGFSRKTLWLTTASANKDPAVIASFYMDRLDQLGCCPQKLVTDAGTEKVTVAAMQSSLMGTGLSHSTGLSPRFTTSA